MNEETRDNAWAKRPEQNGTPGRRGSILVVRQEERERERDPEEGMGENNRGIKLDTEAE